LWDNRQSTTIGNQSMPMFQDEDTHQIHGDMSSIGHPCSTIQGFKRYLSLKNQAVVQLPRRTNNNYPVPGLNVVTSLYKLAILPTPLYRKGISVDNW